MILMYMRFQLFRQHSLLSFCIGILEMACLGQAETQASDRYFKVQLNFAVTNFHFNAEGQTVPYRHYVFPMRCVAGKTRWLIETKFSPNAMETYYCDGTNVLRITRILYIDEAALQVVSKYMGLKEPGTGTSATNAPITLTITPGICPLADFGGNIGWLIYCSSAYLNEPERLIPLPGADIRAVNSSFGWKDTTTRFNDGLALPQGIELRASASLLKKAPAHPSVLREVRQTEDTLFSVHPHFSYPENFLRCIYRVANSTNFLGWNIPLEVIFQQFVPDPHGKPGLSVSLLGTVTQLSEAEEPRNPVVAGTDFNVVDYRFRDPNRIVDSIVYHLTNGIVPPVSDPSLQKLYALRVQRAPVDPVIRSRLGIYALYAVLLLVPTIFAAVHYWRKKCRSQSN